MWQSTISSLPKNIYNFNTRFQFYTNFNTRYNTLPTVKNMSLWKKTTNSLCSACMSKPHTLQNLVFSCNAHLEQGRFIWRHNSILKTLPEYLSSIKENSLMYADIEGFDNPSAITGLDDPPDKISGRSTLFSMKDKKWVTQKFYVGNIVLLYSFLFYSSPSILRRLLTVARGKLNAGQNLALAWFVGIFTRYSRQKQ